VSDGLTIKQVWIIQCKSSGQFLTRELGYEFSLKRAGRLYDIEEALETASGNLDDDFEIHTFFDVELQKARTHHYG
jgi:hypothetical protein